mgnify:CR=1 FL=1
MRLALYPHDLNKKGNGTHLDNLSFDCFKPEVQSAILIAGQAVFYVYGNTGSKKIYPPKSEKRETFDDDQVILAIEHWLEYGQQSYNPGRHPSAKFAGHAGLFSNSGWDARVLRFHLEQLKEKQKEGVK